MDELDGKRYEALMQAANDAGARFADVRAFRSRAATVEIQDGRVEKVHVTRTHGIGVRALVDNAWGFASVNSFDEHDMHACMEQALDMARALRPFATTPIELADPGAPLRGEFPARNIVEFPDQVSIQDKVAALAALERAAGGADPRIANTALTFGDSSGEITVANTRGVCVRGQTVRTRAALRVVAADDNSRQIAQEIHGKQRGFELVRELSPETFSLRAARRATDLLTADAPPSGAMPVVFDPDITGLLAHEAFGHNSEADLVRGGESIIAGKMGEKIASGLVTILDDAAIENGWGSYPFDHEGTPSARRVLVERGVVRAFLHNLESAAHFGMKPEGSARAQNHQFPPVVRMSNTFFEPGDDSFEDVLKKAGDGLYIKGALSGYVATEKGHFTCRASEGFLIRNGVLDRPVRDVAVSGYVLEALERIAAVSRDFALAMPGMCGKSGQAMPVDAGGPHILVSALTVGGAG